jgi:hypothetical protein
VAARDADQFAKNVAERSAHDIAGFVDREMKCARRAEIKTEAIEFERQRASIAPVIAFLFFGLVLPKEAVVAQR